MRPGFAQIPTCLIAAAAVLGPSAICLGQVQPPAEPPRPAPSRAIAPSAAATSLGADLPPADPPDEHAVPADPEDEDIETAVLFIDGTRATGVLVEHTAERVVLVNNGIRRSYAAESVARLETLPPVSERYRQMRAAIGDDDSDQRLMLAQWLRAHRKYQLALDEVSGILGHDPRNPEALRMKTWLEQQLRLRTRAVERVAPGAPPAPAEARPLNPGDPFPTLTPEQINLLRVFEVDLADPPRMMNDPDAITALIDTFAADPLIPATREGREALYRRQPAQILDLMFRLRARDFYGRIQVLSDPASMKLFRERVHGAWLLNSCATSRCHGGEAAGRLFLATRHPNSDATVYTNFLILDRFRLANPKAINGAPAADQKGRPLIDYDEPARSPLLHMAMSRTLSAFPHPDVPDAAGRLKPLSPVFHSTNDRRFRDAVDWIKAMYLPRPDYPIEYTPPLPPGPPPGVLGEVRPRKNDDPFGKR